MSTPTDAPAELTAEQQESLLRQLEFYFCDLSFPFDEFLKGQAAEDGSIPASVIASSPRIVTLAPGLDAAAREALLLSLAARSDSVLVAASGAHFKRRYPLPAEDPAAVLSVYIAGVPKQPNPSPGPDPGPSPSPQPHPGPKQACRRTRTRPRLPPC